MWHVKENKKQKEKVIFDGRLHDMIIKSRRLGPHLDEHSCRYIIFMFLFDYGQNVLPITVYMCWEKGGCGI